MVTGHTEYKGYTMQQHTNALNIFQKFLIISRPNRVLEIGTAGGGFILGIRDILNDIGLENSVIKTFDVVECKWYDEIRKNNIDIKIINIFDQSYLKLEKPEEIVPYIQQEGVTLVLCDGGHKIGEFNMLAPFLKQGDYIMAHDYVDTYENYKKNYIDKIWNWCEIEEKYISEISIKENLEHYNKENFDSIAWVCKVKK